MKETEQELFRQASTPELVSEALEILAKAKEQFKPRITVAMFSGGNDSTTATYLVREHVNLAIHIDTGIGIRETGRTALDHVRRMCEAWELPLTVLRTDPSAYRDIVLNPKAKGFPGPAFHYVPYRRLKQNRVREWQSQFGGKEKVLLVSGIHRKESKRRKYRTPTNPDHETRRCVWVNPILNFNQAAITEVREQAELPQCEGSALIHKSGECLCGAMAKPEELKEIEYWFPETGKYIRDLEREAEAAGKPCCKWGSVCAVKSKAKEVGPLCQSCFLNV